MNRRRGEWIGRYSDRSWMGGASSSPRRAGLSDRWAVDGSVLGGGDVNQSGGRDRWRCRYRGSVGVTLIRWGGRRAIGSTSGRRIDPRLALHRSGQVRPLAGGSPLNIVFRVDETARQGRRAGERKGLSFCLLPYYECCMLNASRTAGTGWWLALAGSMKVTCPSG